jgi:hypothetical protein
MHEHLSALEGPSEHGDIAQISGNGVRIVGPWRTIQSPKGVPFFERLVKNRPYSSSGAREKYG